MPPDANPYVGPRPFETVDADIFFGRDREVSDLVALIVSNPVVLLYAASGAGKSSLLNAAVVGRLERDQQCEVLSVARVRGLREEEIGDRNVFIASVLSHLTAGTSNAQSLRSYLAGREHRETDDEFPAPRALVIDQLEELFTAYPERWADRPAFFEDLAGALQDDPLLRVVLSIREDFLAQLDPYARLLPDGLRARYRLERLSAGAALRAAKEPARRAGRPFADGVAEQLVQDLQKVRLDTELGPKEVVGEYVEPVQLQVACRSVWEALPDSATEITEEHREQFGNVDEVLGTFYDEAIGAAAAASRTRESAMRSRFAERFITPLGTRGTVFWTREETGGIPAAAIKELDDRHLVRAELRAGARWYELTHDRLIEPIRASNRAFARHRAHRRRRAIGGVAVLAGAAAAVAVGLAFPRLKDVRATTVRVVSRHQTAETQQLQRSLADSRGLLATALARTSGGAAASVSRPDVGEIRWLSYSGDGRIVAAGTGGARTGMPRGSSALWSGDHSARPLTYTRGGTSLTAFPDGRLVLSKLGGMITRAVGRVDDVRGVALSSDGVFAAAVDQSGVLRILKISATARPQKVRVFRPRYGVVYETPAFGESSAYVVVVGSDGYVRRAFTDGNRMERVFLLPRDLAWGVALSADGNLLAAYGSGPTIALLDLTGKVIGAFPGGGVATATFSPSGSRLAAAYDDGSVRIWRTLSDLAFSGTLFRGSGATTTLLAEVANLGGSASRATSLDVSGATLREAEVQTHAKTSDEVATRTTKISQHGGHAIVSVPALGAGKHATFRLHLKTVGRPITLAIAQISAFTEQSYDNNAKTVIAPGDTRARIVRAALAGVARSSVRYDDSTLHATMQGVLDNVHLPNVPKTSTTTGFVTWCYREAGAPDPNGQNYKYASGTFLRARGTEVTTTPHTGDLVFYLGMVTPGAQPSPATAVYVGDGDVVTFVRGRLSRVALATLGPHKIRKYPLRAAGQAKHASR
jgi:WD40 repeat protein